MSDSDIQITIKHYPADTGFEERVTRLAEQAKSCAWGSGVEIPPDGDLMRAAIWLDTVVNMSGTYGTMPGAAVVIMADLFNRARDGERPEMHQRLLGTLLHDPGDTLAEICANNLRIVGPEPAEGDG